MKYVAYNIVIFFEIYDFSSHLTFHISLTFIDDARKLLHQFEERKSIISGNGRSIRVWRAGMYFLLPGRTCFTSL